MSTRPTDELRASFLHLRVFLAFIGLLFGAVGLFAVENQEVAARAVFFLFSGLCVSGFAYVSDVHIDEDKVWRSHPWGTYGIRWDELTAVSFATDGGCINFIGGDKRLPILGSLYWRSAGAGQVSAFLDAQLKAIDIVPISVEKLRCGRAKNAKIETPRH